MFSLLQDKRKTVLKLNTSGRPYLSTYKVVIIQINSYTSTKQQGLLCFRELLPKVENGVPGATCVTGTGSPQYNNFFGDDSK